LFGYFYTYLCITGARNKWSGFQGIYLETSFEISICDNLVYYSNSIAESKLKISEVNQDKLDNQSIDKESNNNS